MIDIVSYNVPGLTTDGAPDAVRSALTSVPGVSEVIINLPVRLVQVEYDEEQTTPEALKAIIESTGLIVQRYAEGRR